MLIFIFVLAVLSERKIDFRNLLITKSPQQANPRENCVLNSLSIVEWYLVCQLKQSQINYDINHEKENSMVYDYQLNNLVMLHNNQASKYKILLKDHIR